GVWHSLAALWCHRRSPNLTRLDSDFILKLAAVVSRTAARPGKTEVTDGPEHQVRPAARHGGARPVSLRRLLRPRAAPAAPRRVGPRHHRHVPPDRPLRDRRRRGPRDGGAGGEARGPRPEHRG